MNALASKLYKRITNFILAFVVATATLTAIGPFMAPNASALSVINPANGTWSSVDTRTDGYVSFVDDNGTGALSLRTGPTLGQDKADYYTAMDMALADITELSYVSKTTSNVYNASLQLKVDVDNNGSIDTTLVFEPYYTSTPVQVDTWQTWDALAGKYFWPTNNFGTFTDGTSNSSGAGSYASNFSIADVVADATYGNARVKAIGFNLGSYNPSTTTLIDLLTVNGEVYNFEPFTIPTCSTDATTFDTFSTGDVDGQGGWESTGPFDQAIVENNYGIESFGCKSLRLSNAVTSGSFGDQTFSYSTPNEAGEADSTSAGESGGTRVNRYEAQFDIASTQPTVQTGLSVSVSPDRGDGSRMSYLRFEDQADGIHVYFDDYQVDTFVETELTTLTRAAHTIKFVIDYKDGAANDIVSIYIDGILAHTGTTWEDYYRTDSSQSFEQSPRTTDSLLFRVAGTAAPANSGKGFLFDNVVITTSDSTVVVPEQPGSGEEEVTETTTTTTTTTTVITPIITNPASVLGASDNTDTNTEGNSDVEGTTDDKTATTDKGMNGVILGLAWYWWIIILAGAAGLTWWIIAAYRRRNTEEQ